MVKRLHWLRGASLVAAIGLSASAQDGDRVHEIERPDYVKEWIDAVEARQPVAEGANAWNGYLEAIDRMRFVKQTVEEEIGEQASLSWLDVDPGAFDDAPELIGRAQALYAIVIETGVLLPLDEAANAPRCVPLEFELNPGQTLDDAGLVDLQLARELLDAVRSEMEAALESGDDEAALRQLRRCVALVRCAEIGPNLVHQLVTFSIVEGVCDDLMEAIESGEVSQELAAAFAREVERIHSLLDPIRTVVAGRRSTSSYLDSLFVEAPDRGDAILNASQLSQEIALSQTIMDSLLAPVRRTSGTEPDHEESVEALLRGELNIEIGTMLARRTESLALLEQYFEALIDVAALLPSERAVAAPAVEEHSGAAGPRMRFVRAFMDYTHKPRMRVLAKCDEHRMRASLALTALALEIHRHEHGAYPETLDALVPESIEELPIDPYSGEPLRYRLATDEDRQHVLMPYVLYSVGLEGEDNGAIVRDEHYWPMDALKVSYPGTDYIAHFKRPE